MTNRFQKTVLCSILSVFCSIPLHAAIIAPDSYQYSYAKGKAIGDFRSGSLGRFAVHIDRGNSDKDRNFAILEMDSLPQSRITPEYVKVHVFKGNHGCNGKPDKVIDYQSSVINQKLLPKTLSIEDNTCLEVEYFGSGYDDRLVLVDKFQITLK